MAHRGAITLRAIAVALVALMAAGCAAPGPAATLKIFAAASLTDCFNALSAEFARQHPGVKITPNYAGSSALVTQIVSGAEADLFASADEANMQKLVDARLNAGDATIFAVNRLAIVVPAGNPKGIAQLSDLARPDLLVILGAPAVPVGGYALEALTKAGVRVTARSLETDVKQVVAKVALGEADAGIVYRTDVTAAGAKVQGVEIAERFNVVARYPIAVVKGTKNESAARAFVELLHSAKGREILASFGFVVP